MASDAKRHRGLVMEALAGESIQKAIIRGTRLHSDILLSDKLVDPATGIRGDAFSLEHPHAQRDYTTNAAMTLEVAEP